MAPTPEPDLGFPGQPAPTPQPGSGTLPGGSAMFGGGEALRQFFEQPYGPRPSGPIDDKPAGRIVIDPLTGLPMLEYWNPQTNSMVREALPAGYLNRIDPMPTTGSAGATWRPGELPFLMEQFNEGIRQFNEEQAEKRKSRSLTAARDSLSAYLEASALSDARRLKAMQETRALLPQVVPRNMQYAPGFEPGGPLAGVARGLGADFAPFEMQHVQVDPSQLAQPGPINPEVMKAMAAMEALGAA